MSKTINVSEVSTRMSDDSLTVEIKPAKPVQRSKVVRFLPAFATCMVWLYVVLYSHGPLSAERYAAEHNSSFVAEPLGTLWNELFADYWPMTLAMIAGSLIAGSTPLGGGVVAFPIAVLLIGFKPAEGRDFTVMIQTVGMNAAAYMIVLNKSHLLDFNLIATFTVVGIPGVLMGLALNLPPFGVILTFQILVLEFAFVFFYLNVLAPRSSPSAVPSTPELRPVDATAPGRESHSNLSMYAAHTSMWLASFAGGFLTANVGSGSDICLYAYGLLGWNLLVPEAKRFSDTALTASSVVVMGLLSLVTTVCRVLTTGVSENVIFCWGATCWLVCFGAPLGSLLLTPGLRAQLRIAFYVLAVAQFVGFAVLKIKGNAGAWAAFGGVTAGIFAFLALHFFMSSKRIVRKGDKPVKITSQVLCQRLLKE